MEATDNQPFFIWTIYDRPIDYPEDIVARLHMVSGSGILSPTEHMVRTAFAEALDRDAAIEKVKHAIFEHPEPMIRRDTFLDRDPQDEPHIVGTIF